MGSRRARPLSSSLLLAALTLALAWAPGRASADPTASDRETARALMDEGDRLIEGHDPQGALKAYRAAHALMGVPTTGIEVGKTEAALGMLVEARDTLLAVARIPSQPREPAAFAKARQEATALAAQLAARIPSMVVTVKGGATEPRVEVDGVPIPTAALSLPRKVNPGAHVVKASAAGFSDTKSDVTLAEGEQREVTVTLAPLPKATSSSAPPPPPPPPTQTATSAPPPPSPLRPAMIYGGFGLAGAGLVAGTVTGLLSLSKASGLKNQCPDKVCPPSSQSDIDSSKSLATVSNISFAAGLVGAAVGVVGLFVLSPPASSDEAPQTGLRLSPVVGDRSLGLLGRF